MEIERMNDKELVAALDHYYLEECPFHDEIDASVVPLMIDRLRDQFKIFYRPGIFTPVEPHVCKVNKELEEKYENLKIIYDSTREAYEKFREAVAKVLELPVFEINDVFLERINVIMSENKQLSERKESLIKKCNELIDRNKNIKHMYDASIEKQYRLETENGELLRKVKIQDDSEEVISKLNSKLEEYQDLLHKSVEKVNEECNVCVQYERKKIKDRFVKYLAKKYPDFYNSHKVEITISSLEDVFAMAFSNRCMR